MSLVARITRAREAFVDGEHELGLSLLLELERELQPKRALACPTCGLTFRWPGERDRHLSVSGHGHGEAA
jgi:hypothetical protein